jgi:hypothetical protein
MKETQLNLTWPLAARIVGGEIGPVSGKQGLYRTKETP